MQPGANETTRREEGPTMTRFLDTLAIVVVGLAICVAVFWLAQSPEARGVSIMATGSAALVWAIDRIVKLGQRGSRGSCSHKMGG